MKSLLLALFVSLCLSMHAEDLFVAGGLAVGSGQVGAKQPLIVSYDQDSTGFNVMGAYDPTLINITGHELGQTAVDMDPEFLLFQWHESIPGVSMTIIFDFLPPFDGRVMFSGSNVLLFTYVYDVAVLPDNTDVGIKLRNDLPAYPGGPVLANIYVNGQGHSIHVPIESLPVLVIGEAFIRGDANRDHTVDLADVIFTLRYMFNDGRHANCFDAMDSNDDGAPDISDAIATLQFLFDPAFISLPAPWPNAGLDPTPDGLPACE